MPARFKFYHSSMLRLSQTCNGKAHFPLLLHVTLLYLLSFPASHLQVVVLTEYVPVQVSLFWPSSGPILLASSKPSELPSGSQPSRPSKKPTSQSTCGCNLDTQCTPGADCKYFTGIYCYTGISCQGSTCTVITCQKLKYTYHSGFYVSLLCKTGGCHIYIYICYYNGTNVLCCCVCLPCWPSHLCFHRDWDSWETDDMTIKPHALRGDILTALDGAVTAKTRVPSLHKPIFKGTEGLSNKLHGNTTNNELYYSWNGIYWLHCLAILFNNIHSPTCFILIALEWVTTTNIWVSSTHHKHIQFCLHL